MTFYLFRFRQRRSIVHLKTVEPYDDQALYKGTITLDTPLKAFIHQGKSYNPYAHLCDPFNIAFREDIITGLQSSQLTGWRAYDIQINNSAWRYFGFQITGKCGPLHRPAKTGFLIGMKFDVSTWDGSDFFSAADTCQTFFTEKARTFFLENKFFGDEEIKNIAEVEWYGIASGKV